MKKLQIPIIDMQKQFANYDNLPELYSLHRINKHYNKKGYKLIADLIDEKGWLEGLNQYFDGDRSTSPEQDPTGIASLVYVQVFSDISK